MAKILMTAIVADIRNKLNGSVFSKNRYGAYVRTKVTPVNPQTAAQMAQRASFGLNAQAWRGLTESQRLSWAAAAPDFPTTDVFGNSKILSPSTLYSKLNGNLAAISESAIDTAPSPISIPPYTLATADVIVSTSTIALVAAEGLVPAGCSAIISATPAVGAGQSFVKNKFRQVFIMPTAADLLDFNWSVYSAKFGAPVAGQKIYFSIALVSTVTGQRGLPSQMSTIVVA